MSSGLFYCDFCAEIGPSVAFEGYALSFPTAKISCGFDGNGRVQIGCSAVALVGALALNFFRNEEMEALIYGS